MFYHFIYLAKGFRMRPKVRSTLSLPPSDVAISKSGAAFAWISMVIVYSVPLIILSSTLLLLFCIIIIT